MAEETQNQKGVNMEKVEKLLTYVARKIDEQRPSNVIYFIIDILAKHYPNNFSSYLSVWKTDEELEVEKQNVRNFFKHFNSSSEIGQHFINAGFDSLNSLCCLTPETIDEIEAYNDAQWLPGHKVRVHQIFVNIVDLVSEYKEILRQKYLRQIYPDAFTETRMVPKHLLPKGAHSSQRLTDQTRAYTGASSPVHGQAHYVSPTRVSSTYTTRVVVPKERVTSTTTTTYPLTGKPDYANTLGKIPATHLMNKKY